MSSPEIKNISLFPKGKSAVHLGYPVLLRGALAIVTNVGRVAVDADALRMTSAAEAYGKDAWS